MAAKLAALCGSLREGSFNQRLLDHASDVAEAQGAKVTRLSLADHPLPVYAPHLEHTAFPPQALALKAALRAHDGFLIASPEHNGSTSAALKNAIDWVSRPTDGESAVALSAFRGKACAIMSASPSPFGGLRSLFALRQILSTVQVLVIPEQVHIAFADKVMDGPVLETAPTSMLIEAMTRRLVELCR